MPLPTISTPSPRNACSARPASMCARGSRSLRNELHHRDVRVREHQLQRDEHAVVEATLGILTTAKCRTVEQAGDSAGQCRIARRRVAQFIGVRRKAVIVVNQRGACGRGHAEGRLQPVAGNRTMAVGLAGSVAAMPLKIGHCIPGVPRIPLHEEAGPAPWGRTGSAWFGWPLLSG